MTQPFNFPGLPKTTLEQLMQYKYGYTPKPTYINYSRPIGNIPGYNYTPKSTASSMGNINRALSSGNLTTKEIKQVKNIAKTIKDIESICIHRCSKPNRIETWGPSDPRRCVKESNPMVKGKSGQFKSYGK